VGRAYLTQHSNTHLNLIAQKTPAPLSLCIEEEEKSGGEFEWVRFEKHFPSISDSHSRQINPSSFLFINFLQSNYFPITSLRANKTSLEIIICHSRQKHCLPASKKIKCWC
jgi:hypothetical protein